MLEGRKQPRTVTRLLVHIVLVRDPRLTDLASIENLSSRGARVTTQRPWELGSHVVIRAISGEMSARARVVYCQPILKDFAVGLDFLTQFQ
jgi:PilZ domain